MSTTSSPVTPKRKRYYPLRWSDDNVSYPSYVRVRPTEQFVSHRFGKVLGRTPHNALPASDDADYLSDPCVYVIGLFPEKPDFGIDFPIRWLRTATGADYTKQCEKDSRRITKAQNSLILSRRNI